MATTVEDRPLLETGADIATGTGRGRRRGRETERGGRERRRRRGREIGGIGGGGLYLGVHVAHHTSQGVYVLLLYNLQFSLSICDIEL